MRLALTFFRKDRDSRGGGVAVAFNSKEITLKKLNLNCLKNKPDLEILATRGKLRNYKKELNIFSCYVPPKFSKSDSVRFLDTLSDAIAEAKTSSEGWFSIGADWNHRSLTPLLDMYPDIKQVLTPPTRKNNELDIMLSI